MSIALTSSGIFVGGTRPVRMNRSLKFICCDALLELRAEQTVADPEEAKIRNFGTRRRRDVEQIVVALEMKQPRDRADGDVLDSLVQVRLRTSSRGTGGLRNAAVSMPL